MVVEPVYDLFCEALDRSGRLDAAKTLSRREVAAAATQILTEFTARWLSGTGGD